MDGDTALMDNEEFAARAARIRAQLAANPNADPNWEANLAAVMGEAQPRGQASAPEDKPLASSGSSGGGGSSSSGYTPYTYTAPPRQAMSVEELNRIAQAALSAQFDPQELALRQGLARLRQTIAQEQERLRLEQQQQLRGLSQAEIEANERARRFWASKNLAESGFLAGNQAKIGREYGEQRGRLSEQALQNILQLSQRGETAAQMTNQQLAQLAASRGQAGLALMDRMRREDRQFGLQEAAQALNQWQAQNQLGLQAAQFNQVSLPTAQLNLAQGQQSMSQQAQLFPGQLTLQGQQIAQGQQNLDLGAQMNPYRVQQAAAQAALLGTQAQQGAMDYDMQRQFRNEVGYAPELAQFLAAQLQNERARIQNEIAYLEQQIAQSPDVGLRAQAEQAMAQAQMQLRQMESQIRASIANTINSLATKQGSGTAAERALPHINAIAQSAAEAAANRTPWEQVEARIRSNASGLGIPIQDALEAARLGYYGNAEDVSAAVQMNNLYDELAKTKDWAEVERWMTEHREELFAMNKADVNYVIGLLYGEDPWGNRVRRGAEQ